MQAENKNLPDKTNSILICGTGALATFFAARLSAAGVRVTMLGSWQAALDALNAQGAKLGEAAYPVRAVSDPRECQGAELALVLVKAWQTERTARQLAECLAQDGMAVSLQNGLGNRETLAATLGLERVKGAVTTLGATLLGPGHVRPGGEGVTTLEAHPGLDVLAASLTEAGLRVERSDAVESLVWGKLVVNAAINPLTALFRISNGKLLESPPAREMLAALAVETAGVAALRGIPLPFDDPVAAVEQVARRTASNFSSMYQDVLRGAPTEIDAISGAVARLGGEHAPLNRAMWQLVRALGSW
jgi:2-dehydropantoate 2-reductase